MQRNRRVISGGMGSFSVVVVIFLSCGSSYGLRRFTFHLRWIVSEMIDLSVDTEMMLSHVLFSSLSKCTSIWVTNLNVS